MIVRLHLAPDLGRPWARHGRATASGCGIDADGTLRTGDALAAYFDASPGGLGARAAALRGEFAAIVHDPETGEIAAAVDRIRSTPLFYAHNGATFLLSDDAHRIAGAIGATGIDPLAAAEFMLHGMATGAATLLAPIRQIQAGEWLHAGSDGPQVRRYFTYAAPEHAPPDLPQDEAELIDQAVAGFDAVFERLLRSTEGRQLVVPLSGGLDSRLVAAMLARAGRTDTLCFSYGRRTSREARLSARVARTLGLPWTFIPYTNRRWSHWYRTPSYQTYRTRASRLASIEHEQDWPAVMQLQTRGLVAPDAVFVPGHSGDFLAGSHLPETVFADRPEADPVAWIWDRYYRLWPRGALPETTRRALRRRIAESLAHPGGLLPLDEAVALYDRFGWQERQAKLIVNSIRAYEHHGFDWRIPLWDADLLHFWPYLTHAMRREKRLYRAALRRLLGPVADLPTPPPRRRSLGEKVHRTLDLGYHRYGMYLGPMPVLAALGRRIDDLADFDDPTLRALVDPVRRLPPQTRPLNALIALHQLRDAVGRYGMTG